MTVKKTTESIFEVEFNQEEINVLDHMSKHCNKKPKEILQEIFEEKFQLARDNVLLWLK